MTDLRPCSGCRRHISIDEPVCPFCEATQIAASPHQPLLGRLSRAAVFAGAALATTACGGKKKPETTTTTTDPPTAQVYAGVVEETPAEKTEPEPEPSPVKMPYGAPPARRRVV